MTRHALNCVVLVVALAKMDKRAEAEEKWRKAIELDASLGPQIEQMRKELMAEE